MSASPPPGRPERRRRWRRLRNQVNSQVTRVWADEDPPTVIDEPPPLDLWNVRRPLPAPEEEKERQQSFDFAQRVGAIMLARGAAVEDVEASVRAAALAMGLPGIEVDVTFTSIIVTIRPEPGLPPLTSVGVVRQRNEDHARLVNTHQLLLDLTAGTLGRQEAFDRLEAIEQERHSYGQNVVTLVRGVLAGSIVTQLGGNWSGAVVVAAVAMTIDLVGRWLTAHRVPAFYLCFLGGLIATLAAAATKVLGAQQTPALVVAGSIIVLLPGGALVNGVRDALSGYFVTGVARIFEVLVIVGGLVGGVAFGLAFSRLVHVNMSVLPDTTSLADLPVRVVSAAVTSVAAGFAYYTPRRLLPGIAASGASGMLVLVLVQQLGLSPVASDALAAFAVGLSGYALANAQKAMQVTIVVPAIISLLPGLAIYTALLQLTTSHATSGVVTLAGAGARGVSIAAAVLVAELIGQPVRRRLTRSA